MMGSVHVSFARPLRDFVCFDVCVYFFIGWERAGMWLPSIVLYVFLFVKGFAKHITFACICFVWFLVLNTYTVRTSLGLTLSSAAATDALYLDDLDDVGGETLLLLLLSLWLLLLLLVRLPQVAVIVAMLIAFVVVVAIIIGVVAVTVARLAATARTVLPTLLTMLLLWLMFMWLLLAPAALFNKLLLKNS